MLLNNSNFSVWRLRYTTKIKHHFVSPVSVIQLLHDKHSCHLKHHSFLHFTSKTLRESNIRNDRIEESRVKNERQGKIMTKQDVKTIFLKVLNDILLFHSVTNTIQPANKSADCFKSDRWKYRGVISNWKNTECNENTVEWRLWQVELLPCQTVTI